MSGKIQQEAKRRGRRRPYVALGRELKRHRQGLNILQRDLIAGIYENESQWRSLERGEFRPDREKLIKILVDKFELTGVDEIDRILGLSRYDGLTHKEVNRFIRVAAAYSELGEPLTPVRDLSGTQPQRVAPKVFVMDEGGYVLLSPDEANRVLELIHRPNSSLSAGWSAQRVRDEREVRAAEKRDAERPGNAQDGGQTSSFRRKVS